MQQALNNNNNIINNSGSSNNNNNNNNNNVNNQIAIARLAPPSSATGVAGAGPYIYTHRLPYGARKSICDLLDSDKSWQILGGQLMGLSSTQLQLVGQAILRNCSPTEELLNKLDTANSRLTDLYSYLQQMGHYRALEILKPYLIADDNYHRQHQAAAVSYVESIQNGTRNGAGSGSLNTPTPSFQSIQPMAIMSPSEFDLIAPSDYQNQNPSDWEFVSNSSSNNMGTGRADEGHRNQSGQNEQQLAPTRCHKSPELAAQEYGNNKADNRTGKLQHELESKVGNKGASCSDDPGDEIVRMACAGNRKRTSISDQEIVNQLRLIMQINYAELKQASNDFADTNILGNGGFASVYRGYWKGTDVAIKRLRCNLVHQALNELTILNSYRIDNILPIYGISIDGPEACLVYQFMANGSLDDRLSCKNGTRPLSWQQRAMIAEGVAKGLYYLHTLRDKPLVHGDAKSANVLLDSQFVPKLGDFGLARQMSKGVNAQAERATHCTVTSIHGTSVYLPPEYLRHKILSPAVDVYSYGIVVLEMATGKRAYDGKRLLIDFVEDELKTTGQGQVNLNLKDHRLADITQSDMGICFDLLVRLGVACAHKIKKKRPDMGQVLNNFAHFRFNRANSPIAPGPVAPPYARQQGAYGDTNLQQLVLLPAAPNGLPHTNSGATTTTTTRTLTPDLGARTPTAINENGFNFSLNTGRQQQQQQQHNQNLLDSQAPQMMSFEEAFSERPANGDQNQYQYQCQYQYQHEGGPGDDQRRQTLNDDQQLQQQQQVESAPNQIDAMIPFLTELGISSPPQR